MIEVYHPPTHPPPHTHAHTTPPHTHMHTNTYTHIYTHHTRHTHTHTHTYTHIHTHTYTHIHTYPHTYTHTTHTTRTTHTHIHTHTHTHTTHTYTHMLSTTGCDRCTKCLAGTAAKNSSVCEPCSVGKWCNTRGRGFVTPVVYIVGKCTSVCGVHVTLLVGDLLVHMHQHTQHRDSAHIIMTTDQILMF